MSKAFEEQITAANQQATAGAERRLGKPSRQVERSNDWLSTGAHEAIMAWTKGNGLTCIHMPVPESATAGARMPGKVGVRGMWMDAAG